MACGASLRFDAKTSKMVCDWCGTTVDIKAADEETESIQGFDFNSLEDQAYHPDAEDLPIYNCNSCGAELIAPPEQAALSCPYCGNNIVLTEKVSGKLRPDGLIPFKVTSDSLPGVVNAFYKLSYRSISRTNPPMLLL